MKNKKIIRKITQGMYVLTTNGGGCIVDAVSQISAGENPLISVSVMKSNYTHKLMLENEFFALSILDRKVNPHVIETFGLNSMRDMNKFKSVKTNEVENLKVVADSLGYIVCQKIDSIENETHTLFIGRVKEADVYKEDVAMSYSYYQEHKDSFIKMETGKGKIAWVCTICGHVYNGDILPEKFKCPVCGVEAELFEKREILP